MHPAPPYAAPPHGARLDAVSAALSAELAARGTPRPDVLLLLATGVDRLLDALEDATALELGDLGPAPRPWSASSLVAGRHAGLTVWGVEDLAGDPGAAAPGVPPFVAALPVWVAAVAGARTCIHASAGCALDGRPADEAVRFLLASDHMDLSGQNPLAGLGESRLGPLFPDLSRLHDVRLRRRVLARGRALGLELLEGVVACTPGPSLETPAERRMLRTLGAVASVAALAAPLVACGHAGLRLLSLVALLETTGEADAGSDVVRLSARAAAAAPDLERVVLAALDEVAARSRGGGAR